MEYASLLTWYSYFNELMCQEIEVYLNSGNILYSFLF